MTWQQALHWCIDNPGELVRDKYGQWHQVSVYSGAPRLRCDMEARAFDPSGEPYSVIDKTGEPRNQQCSMGRGELS